MPIVMQALCDVSFMTRFVKELWPNMKVQVLPTGCCGMAGAFGATQSEYQLSKKVGQGMVDIMDRVEDSSQFVASGTSCRHQIEHLTSYQPKHFAELLVDAMIQG